jgi:PA domain-containing protein/type IX secretion system substrate protein
MKKLSLFMILSLIGTFGFAQVIFQVQAPSTPTNLLGSYALTYDNENAGTSWGSPDLMLPANSVTAALEFVDDGDLGLNPTYGFPYSRDACQALINDLTGKIAVLYRADCDFGLKALNAQNAGAVAVVIINHSGGPVGMNGGTNGLNVLIPVIMVSTGTGALLEAAITNGTIVQAFIGNKYQLFTNDLGVSKIDALRARRFSNIQALSTDTTEFSVPVGAWVRNYGSGTQTGATLTATITLNATQIYSQSGSVDTLAPGDSVWVSLPTFSQPWYDDGYYDMNYTVTTVPTADEENSDNVIDVSFMISDSLYSYGRLDPSTLIPISPAQSNGGLTTDFSTCLTFDDPNASRMMYDGMNFTALAFAPNLMAGEYVEANIYQWDDVFTDFNDPAVDMANLVLLDNSFFVYNDETLQDVNVYVPRDGSTWAGDFVDNQRYLFCIASSSLSLLVGFDNAVDYEQSTYEPTSGHLQPSTTATVDGTTYAAGFGTDFHPAISVVMHPLLLSVAEVDNEMNINPFPNPAVNELNIPVGDRNGSATIEIFDIAGKLVISNAVTFNNNEIVKVDVSAITNGSYVGKMNFEDGTSAQFNVVVTR